MHSSDIRQFPERFGIILRPVEARCNEIRSVAVQVWCRNYADRVKTRITARQMGQTDLPKVF
jgi:hypothetical protein